MRGEALPSCGVRPRSPQGKACEPPPIRSRVSILREEGRPGNPIPHSLVTHRIGRLERRPFYEDGAGPG